MSHGCQDLREVARYNLGRKQMPKLVIMLLLCMIATISLSLLLSLLLDSEPFPWIFLVFYPPSYWLYHSEYKRMLEKEILHLKNKDLVGIDRGQTD